MTRIFAERSAEKRREGEALIRDADIHPSSQQVLSKKDGLPGIGEPKRRRPSDGYARR
jgi:hypothetical protein